MDEIVLYPGNWLYNAGVVGLLRILDFGKRSNSYEFTEDGVRIAREALYDFGFLYFAYATKLYLQESFNLLSFLKYNQNKVKKQLGEEGERQVRTELKNIDQEIRQKIFALEAREGWQRFIEHVEDILEGGKKNLSEVLQNLGVSATRLGIELDDFSEFLSELTTTKKASDYLGRFYFNKDVIANPKGKRPQRVEKFDKKYLCFLNANLSQDGEYTCFLCGHKYQDLESFSELTEGDFSSLGISKNEFDNVYSFYTSDGVSHPVKCPLCQLILLCAFAGFNRKPWQISEIDETEYLFVNYPHVEEAYRINNRLNSSMQEVNLKIFTAEQRPFNPYFRTLEIVLGVVERKVRWTLENILFVEIKTSARKNQDKPRFVYFNLERAFAEVVEEFGDFKKLIDVLSFRYEISKNVNIYLSTEVLKRLIQKQSIVPLAFRYLAEKISRHDSRLCPLWSMIVLDFVLRKKRTDSQEVSTLGSREIYGILRKIRDCGASSFSMKEIDSKRRFHLAQRFLSLARGARKEDFCNELLRLYVVHEKPIPEAVGDLIYESEVVSFQEKALAFITGLLSSVESQPQPEVENQTEEVS